MLQCVPGPLHDSNYTTLKQTSLLWGFSAITSPMNWASVKAFPFELLWFLLGFEWNSPHQFEHHSYLPHKKACLGLPVMPCYAWAALLLLSLWADSGGAIPEETSDDVELDNVRQCKECGGWVCTWEWPGLKWDGTWFCLHGRVPSVCDLSRLELASSVGFSCFPFRQLSSAETFPSQVERGEQSSPVCTGALTELFILVWLQLGMSHFFKQTKERLLGVHTIQRTEARTYVVQPESALWLVGSCYIHVALCFPKRCWNPSPGFI